MSDEPWKFFAYTAQPFLYLPTALAGVQVED